MGVCVHSSLAFAGFVRKRNGCEVFGFFLLFCLFVFVCLFCSTLFKRVFNGAASSYRKKPEAHFS